MSHLLMFDIDGTLTRTNDVDGRCFAQAMSEHLGCAIDNDWAKYRHVTDSGIAAELFHQHHRDAKELRLVRNRFVSLLKDALASDPGNCRPISGAADFLLRLRDMAGVVVGLAGGGWADSILAKLRHAEIPARELPLASADDAEARTEIMTICYRRAALSADIERFTSVTYFGDATWDVEAALALGWGFIGIGLGKSAERMRAAGARDVFEDFADGAAILHAIERN
jgi:phosphoglycolate phosphatase-like HAD superfamily hydrolase